MGAVYIKSYEAPQIDRGEILRYAGAVSENAEMRLILDECLEEISGKLTYNVCYLECPIAFSDGELDFGFMKTSSKALLKRMEGCKAAIVFAATVGIEIDRIIRKYSAISSAKQLLFNAIGAERVEALCDVFFESVKKEKAEFGLSVASRFSPGYADLPIEFQREIFSALDCSRKIGITLNQSMLMTPTKSVTAIIGVRK